MQLIRRRLRSRRAHRPATAVSAPHAKYMGRHRRPPEGGRRETPGNPESGRQREDEQYRQAALTDLIERSRAENREDAERYLERLNELKQSVVEILAGTVQEMSAAPNLDMPLVSFGQFNDEIPRPMTVEDIQHLDPRSLDENHTRVWSFSLTEQSDYKSAVAYREGLELGFTERLVRVFPRDSYAWIQTAMRDQMSSAQFDLLRQEYRFTTQDLVRNLRRRAHQLADGGDEFRPPAGLGLDRSKP